MYNIKDTDEDLVISWSICMFFWGICKSVFKMHLLYTYYVDNKVDFI